MVKTALRLAGGDAPLTFVSDQPQSYEEEHLELALEIGRRVALAIEWCRLYERERRAASILTTP